MDTREAGLQRCGLTFASIVSQASWWPPQRAATDLRIRTMSLLFSDTVGVSSSGAFAAAP